MSHPVRDPRDGFVAALVDLAKNDPRIVVVVNDSLGSSKLAPFQEAYPDRTINVGIAEQNMVGVSAGLANAGRIPFVSAAGSFLSARGMEQVKVDAGYSRNNIKLCAQSPGYAYGNLGATHHSAEDLAWMRAIPGMVVLAPADYRETYAAIVWAAAYEGPVYIRIPRLGMADFTPEQPFEAGVAIQLRAGTDATIISTGVVTPRALAAADALAGEGINVRVLHMPTVKPIDADAVLAAATETGAIVAAEEGTNVGALGGAIAELVSETNPVPVVRVGVPDEFPPTGSETWILDHYGVDAEGIAAAVKRGVDRKTN